MTTDGTSNQQSTSPPNAQPELSISPLVNVFVQGGAPILIIDPDTIQVRDVDSSLFSELLIYITNPQDGSNNEIIEFSRQLPASALSVGPSLTTGGEILYRVTFLNGGANADRVTEAISVIRYNNLRAAASITVSPPRIICLTIEDFETASDRACVIVTISPPNLFDPVFVMDSVSASVTERNQQIFIATLTATDSDTGPQATIAYSITQVISYFMNTPLFTSDIFTIGSSNGNITAPNGLDTESYMRHTITVRASDMGNPVRSATATVTVNVLDANDVAPSFTGTPYIAGSQREELAPPRFVFLVTAVDLDVTAPNNIIQSYGLENYQTLFTIDSTGVITLIAPLDAEVQDEFMINVSAVDRGTPPQTGYTTVQFRLIDFNDNAARIAQVSAATFVIGDGPTSIGPALVIDDPDIGPSAINYISVTLTSNPTDARLTIDLCFCQCQDDRLADAAFSQQAINLLNLATFQQDQPETSGAVNFYPVPFGIGRCRAWELRRGITSQNDGYGRIPRSSLPSNFAVGDFSFSFALAQTDEGYLISIPDQTNPNLPTASVNRQFAIWIRRYDFRFYYTTNSIIGDDNPAVLRLNQHTILQEFFEPFSNSPMVHHFTIIVNSSPPIVDIYVDCRLLGSLVLTGPVMTPSNNIDVFIGQSRPRVTNGGRLAGVVSEFYYYPRALTYSEVQNICNCGEETIDLPPVLPTNVTTAITTNTAESEPIYILVIEPTSGVIPVDNAVSILRGITYTNTFNFPDIRIDRELTFVVREETGVEETTFGYIRLIANGFSQTSVSDFQNFICNLSQAVILPSTSVVESHGSTIQPSTTGY